MAQQIDKMAPPGSMLKTGGPVYKHKNSGALAKREGNSKAHLVLIRQLHCCVCGQPAPNEAHHLKLGTKERGAGMRSTDKRALPMCHEHHMEIEAAGTKNETSWFMKRGIDALRLAHALWKATGDLAAMRLINATHAPGVEHVNHER